MPNPPKQFHEGYWYHVYARSLDEVRLFESDEERNWFLNKLDDVFTRRRIGLGALCLMDTHYHALARMGPVRLDRALNGLHMSYAKHINRERDRRGSVFDRHPGTDIVLQDDYLLQLVPYIHNNPVEAGIVEKPEEYTWHTDGLYRRGTWDHGSIECWSWPPHFDGDDRVQVYREQLDGEAEIPRSDEGYVGTEEEWKNLEKRDEERSGRHRDRRGQRPLEELAREYAEDFDLSIKQLREPGRHQPEARVRQVIMAKLYEDGFGPTEIGKFFNREKGTVAYAVRQQSEKD